LPIKVVLQDIRGCATDQVLDPNCLLQRIWPIADGSFPLLQYIDPYGNTIFNQVQMGQVLKELEILSSKTNEGDETLLVSKVRTIAQRCRDNPRAHLRFVGD